MANNRTKQCQAKQKIKKKENLNLQDGGFQGKADLNVYELLVSPLSLSLIHTLYPSPLFPTLSSPLT